MAQQSSGEYTRPRRNVCLWLLIAILLAAWFSGLRYASSWVHEVMPDPDVTRWGPHVGGVVQRVLDSYPGSIPDDRLVHVIVRVHPTEMVEIKALAFRDYPCLEPGASVRLKKTDGGDVQDLGALGLVQNRALFISCPNQVP